MLHQREEEEEEEKEIKILLKILQKEFIRNPGFNQGVHLKIFKNVCYFFLIILPNIFSRILSTFPNGNLLSHEQVLLLDV